MCQDLKFHLFADLKKEVGYKCKRQPATKIEWCLPDAEVRTLRPSVDGKRTIYEDWKPIYLHKLGFTNAIENLTMEQLPVLNAADRFKVSDYFRLDPDRNGLTEAWAYGSLDVCYLNSTHEKRSSDIPNFARLIHDAAHHGGRWFDDMELGPYRLRLFIQFYLDSIGWGDQYRVSDIKPVVVQHKKYKPCRVLKPLSEWFCDDCGTIVTFDTGELHRWEPKVKDDFGGIHYLKLLCEKCGHKHYNKCKQGYIHRHGELPLIMEFGTNPDKVIHHAIETVLRDCSCNLFQQRLAGPRDFETDVNMNSAAMADPYRLNNYFNVMRRFLIPYYEQARFYFDDPLIVYRYQGYWEEYASNPVMLADTINTCLQASIDLDEVATKY